MIFKEIDNMKDVEDICHYFSETENRLYIYSPKDFMKWSQQYLQITVTEDAIKEIEEVKLGDEKYLGDKANRQYSLTWTELDRLPQIEYKKIDQIRKIFDNEMDKNPEMTEEEANQMLLRIDEYTVNRHTLRIRFPSKKDHFEWEYDQKIRHTL